MAACLIVYVYVDLCLLCAAPADTLNCQKANGLTFVLVLKKRKASQCEIYIFAKRAPRTCHGYLCVHVFVCVSIRAIKAH